MANLTIGDFTRSRLAMPAIAPNLSGAELLSNVSRSLDKISQDSLQEWQQAEVNKATAEGEADGASNSIQYREGNTVTAAAYQQSADKTRMNMLGVESQIKFNALKETYATDPGEFMAQSNEYITQTVDSLAGSPAAQAMMEGQLKLKQQADGYAIQKRYQKIETEKFKTSTESLIHTMKTSAYETAGEIFSKDQNSQALALNQFGLSKKLLDSSLNAVTPQGEAVYSSGEKSNIMNQFHADFYTRAASDYFTNNDLSTKEMANLIDGKLEISIPGTDQKINILREVGVDAYEKDVTKAAINSMNQRNVEEKQANAADKAQLRIDQDIMSFDIMSKLKTGGTMQVNQVNDLVKSGAITASQGKSLIDEVLDPSIVDNEFTVEEINNMIINGEDASQTIAAGKLSSKTYVQLSKANANALNSKTEGLDKENMKMIKEEFQDVGQYGFASAEEVRTTNDIQAIYQRNRQEGMPEDLAFEKARILIDVAKDNKFKRVNVNVRINENKSVDIAGTVSGMETDLKAHILTQEEFDVQLALLTKLQKGQVNND